MELIPVVDLSQGRVVRAVRGDRGAYRPIVSPLCTSSDPAVVARILVGHCAARRLYVADLDALQGRAVQVDVLVAVLQAVPAVELWLDAGSADAASARRVQAALGPHGARLVPVFGSESIRGIAGCFAPGDARAVLSLDRRDGLRLDATGAWDTPAAWPRRVIVMTLERVGADAGPDLDTLAATRARAPGMDIIGAGGIRHPADLRRGAEAGAAGWLVASALHDLRIPPVRS